MKSTAINNESVDKIMLLTTIEDVPTIVFRIPYGQARFRIKENGTKGFALIVYSSDKALEPGRHTQEELWDNQLIVPAFGIHIETAEQARVWAIQFEHIAAACEFRTQKDNGSEKDENLG